MILTDSAAYYFLEEFRKLFREATAAGESTIDIRAGDVMNTVEATMGCSGDIGGCCRMMIAAIWTDDEVLVAPQMGIGPNLTIRYRLPRRQRPTVPR